MERMPGASQESEGSSADLNRRPGVCGALRLELRAEQMTVFPDNPSRALHGALHRAIERLDPSLSIAVHGAAETPLVCSPLRWTDPRAGDEPVGRQVGGGARVWARIAVLEREALVTLLAALDGVRWRAVPIVLERPFAVERVALGSLPGGRLPALVAYADLAAMARPEPEVRLRFTSPTFFRQAGRVLPDPAAAPVFLSHLRRWRVFAGTDLPGVDPDGIRRRVRLLGRPEGAIHETNLLGRGERGFVGVARYGIDGDDAFRRGIATLAAYAAYCGTGARTAFGMGQTERIG